MTFSVGNEVLGYVILDSSNGYKTGITVETDNKCPLTWTVSWFAPDAEPLAGSVVNWVNKETETAAEPAETTAPAVTTATTQPSALSESNGTVSK